MVAGSRIGGLGVEPHLWPGTRPPRPPFAAYGAQTSVERAAALRARATTRAAELRPAER